MKRLVSWLPSSWFVRFGFALLVIGLAIVLIYHGILLTILPLDERTKEVISYGGHVIAFIGMNIALGGILFARKKELPRDDTPARKDTRHFVTDPIVVRRK